MSALASDDPVVREIPVFLSTELSEVLYLIQHPLFSTARGEPPVPSTARLRPLHGKLETSTVIPLNEHFDQQADERQAITEHRFVSTEVTPQTHLCLGAMRDGALHLCPVRRVLQMRPSLQHINAFEDREKNEMRTIYDDDDDEEDEEAKKSKRSAKAKAEADAKQEKKNSSITGLGYQKRESEQARARRLGSWAHQHSAELSEPFVDLVPGSAEGEAAAEDFEALFFSLPDTDEGLELAAECAPLSLDELLAQGIQATAQARASGRLSRASPCAVASEALPSPGADGASSNPAPAAPKSTHPVGISAAGASSSPGGGGSGLAAAGGQPAPPMPACVAGLGSPAERVWLLACAHALLETHGLPAAKFIPTPAAARRRRARASPPTPSGQCPSPEPSKKSPVPPTQA